MIIRHTGGLTIQAMSATVVIAQNRTGSIERGVSGLGTSNGGGVIDIAPQSIAGHELVLACGTRCSRHDLRRLHAAQRPPCLGGAERDALVLVPVLSADVHAALH